MVNNIHSKPLIINCGVPQGSILGPLLFNLYINDLASASNLTVRLYADDACLTYSHHNISSLENKINSELMSISDWFKINKLSVNYTKSNFMLFTKAKQINSLNILLDGNILDRVKTVKYLGIHLDEKLNWKTHVDIILNKVTKASYIISKIRHYVDLSTLKILYYS